MYGEYLAGGGATGGRYGRGEGCGGGEEPKSA